MAYTESTHVYCRNNAEFLIVVTDDGAGNPVPTDLRIEIAADGPGDKLGSRVAVPDPLTYNTRTPQNPLNIVVSQAHVLGPLPIGGLAAGGNAVWMNPGTALAGRLLLGVDNPDGITVGDFDDMLNDGSASDQGIIVWGKIAFKKSSTQVDPGGMIPPPDGVKMTTKRGRIPRVPVYISRLE